MKTLIYSFPLLLLPFLMSNSAKAQLNLDLETGALFTGYNDVRSPGDLGTFISLKDDLVSKTTAFVRFRANYTIKSRHTLSLLYAPLKTKSDGIVGRDILFEDVLFDAYTPLNGTYKFNSYRFTYRYKIVDRPKIEFGLGLTAKIREASIGLSSAEFSAEKSNVGFVPIVNFRLWWKMTEQFGLLLEGDALAAPQGRAEDVQFAATYNFSDYLGIRVGYRILEGGSDNDEVYTFSMFHYASVGISYTFNKKMSSKE